jgi:hypothetical protein
VYQLLDDRLFVVGIESRFALVSLKHMEHGPVVLVLFSCQP